jgi:xylulose-5-phosphate/fructose-6-phosphate phosphoketolase
MSWMVKYIRMLETLAAISMMRAHLPDLKIRVVNIVDLMKLQPQSEHPHGLSGTDFDELFTRDKPVIFVFHTGSGATPRERATVDSHRKLHT